MENLEQVNTVGMIILAILFVVVTIQLLWESISKLWKK